MSSKLSIKSREGKKGTSWYVEGTINGKRVRPTFKTKALATAFIDQLKQNEKSFGEAGVETYAKANMPVLVAALKLLPEGHDAYQAIKFYTDHLDDVLRHKRTVNEVVEELIAEKIKKKRAKVTITGVSCTLRRFANDPVFSGRPIYEIRPPEIDDWLWSGEKAAATRRSDRRRIADLFYFAKRKDYVIENPILKVDRIEVPHKRPGFLRWYEAEALLMHADWDLIPALAIGLFAGCRALAEVAKMKWSWINLEGRRISVEETKGNLGHRFVNIDENLAEWLKPYFDAGMTGSVCLRRSKYNRLLRKAKKAAIEYLEAKGLDASNLRKLPNSAFRHTYATHKYLKVSAEEVARQMGHVGLNTLTSHYLDRTTDEEATLYWKIVPTTPLIIPDSPIVREMTGKMEAAMEKAEELLLKGASMHEIRLTLKSLGLPCSRKRILPLREKLMAAGERGVKRRKRRWADKAALEAAVPLFEKGYNVHRVGTMLCEMGYTIAFHTLKKLRDKLLWSGRPGVCRPRLNMNDPKYRAEVLAIADGLFREGRTVNYVMQELARRGFGVGHPWLRDLRDSLLAANTPGVKPALPNFAKHPDYRARITEIAEPLFKQGYSLNAVTTELAKWGYKISGASIRRLRDRLLKEGSPGVVPFEKGWSSTNSKKGHNLGLGKVIKLDSEVAGEKRADDSGQSSLDVAA